MTVYPVNYWPAFEKIPVTEDVALYIDQAVLLVDTNAHDINVVYLVEPADIIGPVVQEFLLVNWRKFDLILTDQSPLLALPNARLFLHAQTWVHEPSTPTKYGISTIAGTKVMTYGHRMRHELWSRQNEIKTPTAFYESYYGGPPGAPHKLVLGEDSSEKAKLFQYQFHIAIENSQSEFYISEKIIDCFRSRTVPVYFGATRISDFFNAAGIIQCNSVTDIVKACNAITPGTYASMLNAIEDNYKRCDQYTDIVSRITSAVKSVL